MLICHFPHFQYRWAAKVKLQKRGATNVIKIRKKWLPCLLNQRKTYCPVLWTNKKLIAPLFVMRKNFVRRIVLLRYVNKFWSVPYYAQLSCKLINSNYPHIKKSLRDRIMQYWMSKIQNNGLVSIFYKFSVKTLKWVRQLQTRFCIHTFVNHHGLITITQSISCIFLIKFYAASCKLLHTFVFNKMSQ